MPWPAMSLHQAPHQEDKLLFLSLGYIYLTCNLSVLIKICNQTLVRLSEHAGHNTHTSQLVISICVTYILLVLVNYLPGTYWCGGSRTTETKVESWWELLQLQHRSLYLMLKKAHKMKSNKHQCSENAPTIETGHLLRGKKNTPIMTCNTLPSNTNTDP